MGAFMREHSSRRPATDDNSWTSKRLLRWIHGHLEAQEVDSPRVCAELLVGHSIGSDRLRLYMEPDRLASPDELAKLRSLVSRAARHEPVQYLVGSWPFFGRAFEVDPCTLIPRPSTETLVELALEECSRRGLRRDCTVLDLCTGGGCIAVSLAASIKSLREGRVSDRRQPSVCSSSAVASEVSTDLPVIDLEQRVVAQAESAPGTLGGDVDPEEPVGSLRIVATDIVEEAVRLAGRNAARHGVDGLVECRLGSLFDALEETDAAAFDVVCANPPYVTDAEYEELDRNVRDYEPATALRGGPLGVDLIRPILEQAPHWLSAGGLLLVEIGDPIHERVRELASSVPGLVDVRLERDHEGLQRVLIARAG